MFLSVIKLLHMLQNLLRSVQVILIDKLIIKFIHIYISRMLLHCSDGQKMSKRKKNYPDPMDIVSKYGADAIR